MKRNTEMLIELLGPQGGDMVLRLLFTSRLQWEMGCCLCVFQVLLWLSMTFFHPLAPRCVPEKVNLNMIIFCMLEILPFKELWSPCKSNNYTLVYFLYLEFPS